MAGTEWSAYVDDELTLRDVLPMPGNAGIGLPFGQWVYGERDGGGPKPVDWSLGFLGTSRTASGGGGAPMAPGEHPAFVDDSLTAGRDWYERVHILPRTTIDFGSILAQADEEFEVYNAFRSTSVTISSFLNGASPGIELPDTSPPVVIPAQSSHLRSSSTANDAGTGLGTLDLTRVRALRDGLPSFNAAIVFDVTAPGEDVELRVAGIRVVLVPFNYESGIVEILSAKTEVDESVNGKEQRRGDRKRLRQAFEGVFQLKEVDRQSFEAVVFDSLGSIFGLPLWHDLVRTTAAVSAGAVVYPVSGADDADFRVGGLAVAITDAYTFDVISIDAVSDTQIDAASASAFGYPAGTIIAPVRLVRINEIDSERELNFVQRYRFRAEVDDNDTGVVEPTSTPGFWSTYAGRILLDDCNATSRRTPIRLSRNVHIVDNDTGKVTVTTDHDYAHRSQRKGFSLRTREQIKDFRRLFGYLGGRRIAFWSTSRIEDLTPVADLTIGAATMDVSRIDYVRFVRDREPMATFEIHFDDGTSLVRTVISSALQSATVERLTLDDTWPANRTVSEIERIEFRELVRFDSDEARITHVRLGLAATELPMVRATDDD